MRSRCRRRTLRDLRVSASPCDMLCAYAALPLIKVGGWPWHLTLFDGRTSFMCSGAVSISSSPGQSPFSPVQSLQGPRNHFSSSPRCLQRATPPWTMRSSSSGRQSPKASMNPCLLQYALTACY